jgi:hypothetical protein
VLAERFAWTALTESLERLVSPCWATHFFQSRKKVSKNACPSIRVSLRETSLISPALRRPAYKGHPWPFKRGRLSPLAASMPLAPLHTDSIRPPERGGWSRLAGRARNAKSKAKRSLLSRTLREGAPSPASGAAPEREEVFRNKPGERALSLWLYSPRATGYGA